MAMPRLNFFTLTEEEIFKGIRYLLDATLEEGLPPKDDPLMAFIWDARLQRCASMWLACDRDIIAMKLRFANELEDLHD